MLAEMVKKFDEYCVAHFGEDVSVWTKMFHTVKGVADYVLLGSTVTDYFELTFYKKSFSEKKKYMTFRDSNRFAKAFDDLDEGWNLSKKTELMTWLGKFLCREQISAQDMRLEAFQAFTKSHPVFLFKPSTGSCGIGIEKADASVTPVEDLFSRYAGQDGVLDECILQHPAMEKLHPDSVNTLRIFSVRIRSDIHIAAAVLRMGNGGSFIDNYSAGGVVAPVDVHTGLVTAAAEDIYGKRYIYHPYTNAQIVGFQIPNWEAVIATVTEAAKEAPISYVGWDVAVRNDDCVIIEANYRPMVNVVQTADGGGKKALFESYLKEKNGESQR